MFGPVCICKGNSVLQMGAIPKTDDGGFHCERLRRHPTSMDHCLWISPSTHKMVQYSASAKHACVLEDSLQACVCVFVLLCFCRMHFKDAIRSCEGSASTSKVCTA